MVARPADADHRGVAERRHDPDREPALDDQVQRVARIVAMEDDLVTGELAAARHREQPADLFVRDAGEQPPLHAAILVSRA